MTSGRFVVEGVLGMEVPLFLAADSLLFSSGVEIARVEERGLVLRSERFGGRKGVSPASVMEDAATLVDWLSLFALSTSSADMPRSGASEIVHRSRRLEARIETLEDSSLRSSREAGIGTGDETSS